MVIILSLVTVACTILSCIYAALSVRKVTGESMSPAVWLIMILLNGVFVMLSWTFFNNPWVYITVLAALSVLSILNKEGERRRLSWWYLILQYSIVLLFAVANYADRHNGIYKGSYVLWWLIPILVAVICNFGINSFLNRGKKVKSAAKAVGKKLVNKLDSLAEPEKS